MIVYVFEDTEGDYHAFSGEFRTAKTIFEMVEAGEGHKVKDDDGEEITKLKLARGLEQLGPGEEFDVFNEDDDVVTTIRKLEVG